MSDMRALLTLLLPLACAAQPDPFLHWLNQKAQHQLDQRDRTIAQITTRAQADARRAEVRKKILDSIGGLVTYNGPLRSRVTGTIKANGYAIEKVIFESLPGFYITANLYRPATPGRYPAILVPAGHTQEGKPEAQHLAANLARKGYIALTYDPIGQGEREQTYLPELGRALSGGGGNEHIELGGRSLLIGQSVARYFIHDAKRSVDYLLSRPDVDPARLGVTGCSGGGAIATYAGAFDPRLKVAASACFINSFRTLYTGPTADSEMTLPRFLVNGLDWADVFNLPAPLPWLLLATTEDYFTPAGAQPVYDEVRHFYKLYNAEEKVRFAVGPGPHGTPRESREEIYRWMNRWLKNEQASSADEEVHLYTNHELKVTASGNVDGEPQSRKLYQVIHEEYKATRQPKSTADLKAKLNTLNIAHTGPAPQLTNGQFESEPGITINAKLHRPNETGRRPAVIVVEEKRLPVPLYVQRSQSTEAIVEGYKSQGYIVLEVEPRDSPAVVDGRPFLGNWLTNERVEIIGGHLPAMRAHDILAAVSLLEKHPDVDPAKITAYARGAKGFWLLLAAAVDPRLKRIWLDRTPISFQSALESPLTNNLFEALIPGFARHWDLADLKTLIGPARIYSTDPTNWMNKPVFPGPGHHYRHVGEPIITQHVH